MVESWCGARGYYCVAFSGVHRVEDRHIALAGAITGRSELRRNELMDLRKGLGFVVLDVRSSARVPGSKAAFAVTRRDGVVLGSRLQLLQGVN